MDKNYIPYGEEWEKEMSKFPKALLIARLGEAYTKLNAAPSPEPEGIKTLAHNYANKNAGVIAKNKDDIFDEHSPNLGIWDFLYEAFLEGAKSTVNGQGGDENDPFIKKHLANIKETMLEAFIRHRLQHLQHPPLDASVKYFLEKGSINGNFLLAIKDIVYGLPKLIQSELDKQLLPSGFIETLRKFNPHIGHGDYPMHEGWEECCDKAEQLLNKMEEAK